MQPTVALDYARRSQGASTLILAAVFGYVDRAAAIGVLLGGGLMALHLTLLQIIAHFWLRQPQGHVSGKVAGLLLSKFLVMVALTGAILIMVRPHATGFVAGLGTFMVGIAGACMGRRAKLASLAPHAPRS